MLPLARILQQAGFATVNWGYHSLIGSIEAHAHRFRAELDQLQSQTSLEKIHIVAHSMGSLVTRQALLVPGLDKLQRIVMLCPPNHGSHAASLFPSSLGWLSRPLLQLSDRPNGFACRLPQSLPERYEVGIIAAENDFVVRRESTSLLGAKESIVVPSFHSGVLFRRQTAELTANFISQGSFHPGSESQVSRPQE